MGAVSGLCRENRRGGSQSDRACGRHPCVCANPVVRGGRVFDSGGNDLVWDSEVGAEPPGDAARFIGLHHPFAGGGGMASCGGLFFQGLGGKLQHQGSAWWHCGQGLGRIGYDEVDQSCRHPDCDICRIRGGSHFGDGKPSAEVWEGVLQIGPWENRLMAGEPQGSRADGGTRGGTIGGT